MSCVEHQLSTLLHDDPPPLPHLTPHCGCLCHHCGLHAHINDPYHPPCPANPPCPPSLPPSALLKVRGWRKIRLEISNARCDLAFSGDHSGNGGTDISSVRWNLGIPLRLWHAGRGRSCHSRTSQLRHAPISKISVPPLRWLH